MSGSNLLVIVTGSIAAYKACEVVSRLVQQGHRVRVIATEASLKFVGGTTWEGLTGQPVLSDLFQPGTALEHIQLSRWADLILVCPATANTLNRFAAGLGDDLAGALWLARDPRKPFLVAPAMNPAMWQHPATAAAVSRLQEWGVALIEAGVGRTACGELGVGRLAEPDQVAAAVTAALIPAKRRLRVLVTSGPTAEPIDGVRVISNLSSGQTGAGIAEYLQARGHEVTLLRGRASAGADFAPAQEFGSGAELGEALRRQLGGESFDAVIHAAAVSDFTVDSIESEGSQRAPAGAKLSSDRDLTLHLRRTAKLVDGLRQQSRNPAICVIAFKLTVGASAEERAAAVRALFSHSGADLVVQNDLARRGAAGEFPADLYRPDGSAAAHCSDRTQIAGAIEAFLLQSLPASSHYAALP
jgi:phosphopantothenoylcysteine decarboxylase/phosphopantothenate--cysteine ligase